MGRQRHRRARGGMAPDNLTGDLAGRIEQGDPAAEESLVEAYYGRVFAMALVRTGDREVARDLAQEIMLAVLCALREGRLNDSSGLTIRVKAAACPACDHTPQRYRPEDIAVDLGGRSEVRGSGGSFESKTGGRPQEKVPGYPQTAKGSEEGKVTFLRPEILF